MKNKCILVGTFYDVNESKRAAEQAKRETGYEFVKSKMIYRNGVPYGIKLWVCEKNPMLETGVVTPNTKGALL